MADTDLIASIYPFEDYTGSGEAPRSGEGPENKPTHFYAAHCNRRRHQAARSSRPSPRLEVEPAAQIQEWFCVFGYSLGPQLYTEIIVAVHDDTMSPPPSATSTGSGLSLLFDRLER